VSIRLPVAGAIVAASIFAATSCGGGGGNATAAPIVDRIDDAIAAVEAHYGAPQQYFEISATIAEVNVIVAVDGGTQAEQARFTVDGGLTMLEPVGAASGSTFGADAVDFDPDVVFDRLRDELGDPVIVDFAIQGTSTGTAVYDATVASDGGGVLLVLLGATGQILGAQAQ
jgi:hypothetical protein